MSFSYINPANQLKREAKIARVHQQILDKVTSLPVEVRKDKMNMELLKLICNCVENSINNTGKKDKMKINKKELAINVIVSLFGKLNPTDIETIEKNIEYLCDNEQIVKYSTWIIIGSTCIDWLKKKLA